MSNMVICENAAWCGNNECEHIQEHKLTELCSIVCSRYGKTECLPVGKQGIGNTERFWICWVEGTDWSRHYRHWTLDNAQAEAEELARITGKEVYVFECQGKWCKTEQQPVKWEIPR